MRGDAPAERGGFPARRAVVKEEKFVVKTGMAELLVCRKVSRYFEFCSYFANACISR